MRTLLDLPDDLMQEARVAAVRRGVTLRELVIEALRAELHRPSTETATKRLKLPLIDSGPPGSLRIGQEEILQADFEDDVRRSGMLD